MTTATTAETTTTEKLAREFSRLMRRDLTAPQMKKVNAMNAKHEDMCSSHEFIDSNMTMAEAFETVVGRSPDVGGDTDASQADITLWNDAWNIAQKNKFFVDKFIRVLHTTYGAGLKATTTVVDAEVVDGYKSEVTYRTPEGYLKSASWNLLFISEALDLAPRGTTSEVCDMVGMPGDYDWSFIRDADSETLKAVGAMLYKKVGRKMNNMNLASAAHFKGGR